MNTSPSTVESTVDQFTEVEQKFVLIDLEAARRRIEEFGGELLGKNEQRDVYFDAEDRSFRARPNSSEWLRLRFQGGAVSLNYKLWHPLEAVVKTHCDEFETRVSNGEAMRRTLQALGYKELVVVSKVREEWRLDEAVLAIDIVEGLGSFIEFEYYGDGLTVAEAHDRLTATVNRLDLDLGPSHEGYPHQLLAKAGRS